MTVLRLLAAISGFIRPPDLQRSSARSSSSRGGLRILSHRMLRIGRSCRIGTGTAQMLRLGSLPACKSAGKCRRPVSRSTISSPRPHLRNRPVSWSSIVRGLGFSEVDFFRRSSRTLVLTDLVQNLETERLPAITRIMARLNGIAAPWGRAPIYLRLVVKANRREAAQAAARLVEWQPERVIFSHGRWFERDGTEALRRSLDWLVS